MATKSFTTTMKFSAKSIDKLINAIDNSKSANLRDVSDVSFEKRPEKIKNILKMSIKK